LVEDSVWFKLTELTGTKCLNPTPALFGRFTENPRLQMSEHNGKTESLPRTRIEMIEAAGRLCQLLGVPRSTGQIYGLLYLSPKPLSLDEIASLLEISKGSASNGARQLAGWGVIKQVWVPGERRDHYDAEPDIGTLLRAGYTDFLKPRLASSSKRIEQMESSLEDEFSRGSMSREEYRICSMRLKNFAKLQKKLQMLLPLAQKFL
jgi:HTH-type transcriptional regulator, glycine betaine synthesis regulator